MTSEPGVVVVGASAAGLSVAETLRRDGFAGSVTLVGEEDLPYDRPPLSKEVLAGTWSEDRVMLRDSATIDAMDVDLRLGVRAERVDTTTQTVELSDGSRVDYRDLVIATGVRPRRLPDANGIAGVHVLRTLEDARRLRSAVAGGPRVVIVGAGFLGAEVASVARTAGATVTLVSDVDAPLSDVLGRDLGRLLIDVHTEHGVVVRTGVKVGAIVAEDGRVTGVQLADGSRLPADVVLVSIGSLPNVEWLADSGIPIGNGVLCDEFCRAAPGVWAAGDVASWYHVGIGERVRLEHRTNAAEQGMAVARNILAGANPTPFVPVPYIWSDQYDLKIQSVGRFNSDDELRVAHGTLDERRFVALFGRSGRLVGALGFGRPRHVMQYRRMISERRSFAHALEHAAQG
ncbi:MAG: hypothetical protein QOJ95_5194 [Mycobacterium sp.]|nr:hypothetical protein [Mycobacterium sp.]